jgi:hypothetical protein
MAVMPPSRCSSTWQWNIDIPTLSGTISAVTNCAGSKEKMSVRCPPIETTFPCQCGVCWRSIREASMQSYFLLLILFRTRNHCKICVSPDTSKCIFANQAALHCDTPL